MNWKMFGVFFLVGSVGSEIIWQWIRRRRNERQKIEDLEQKLEIANELKLKAEAAALALEARKPEDLWNTVFFFPDLGDRNNPQSPTAMFFNMLDQAKMSLRISLLVGSLFEFENLIYKKKDEGLLIQVITDYDTMSAHNNVNCRHFKQRGIPVKTKSTGHLMHNKFVIVDEEAVTTGSPNFTQQAFFRGSENIVITTNPRIVKEYIKQFDYLWQHCRNYADFSQ